jgi:uncharacterized membrane protein YbaN (DUF454 family)
MFTQIFNRAETPISFKTAAYFICGQTFFLLGLIGAFLPVLPTTGFWILAAICFAKCSPVMYRRIVGWPGIGPVIEAFITRGTISRKGKIAALTGMAAAAAIVLLSPLAIWPMAFALAGISIGAGYVATRPESRRTLADVAALAPSASA